MQLSIMDDVVDIDGLWMMMMWMMMMWMLLMSWMFVDVVVDVEKMEETARGSWQRNDVFIYKRSSLSHNYVA